MHTTVHDFRPVRHSYYGGLGLVHEFFEDHDIASEAIAIVRSGQRWHHVVQLR